MQYKHSTNLLSRFFLLVLICSPFCSIIFLNNFFASMPTQAETSFPFFDLTLLIPATSLIRNQWGFYITDQLSKIGINTQTIQTGWAQISQRTWDYPAPYPISSYDEGGYDILCVGWSWGLDWDPSGLFDKAAWLPNGFNFYQYYSPEMENAIGNYTQSYSYDVRINWAEEIQRILYRDVPASTIFYPLSLYSMAEDLTGMDGLLWSTSYQPMEHWSMSTDTEFHYATPADYVDFHPHYCSSVYDRQWLRQIYNGMIERQNGTHFWGPRIATNWVTNDGLTFTIDLDPNAKWADGVSINASDIQYNYQLIIDPDYAHPDVTYWSSYINENTVTIIDEFTVNMTFTQPYIFQEGNLALDLLPKHIWESVPPKKPFITSC